MTQNCLFCNAWFYIAFIIIHLKLFSILYFISSLIHGLFRSVYIFSNICGFTNLFIISNLIFLLLERLLFVSIPWWFDKSVCRAACGLPLWVPRYRWPHLSVVLLGVSCEAAEVQCADSGFQIFCLYSYLGGEGGVYLSYP